MDGDEAAAAASYPFIDAAFLYPITPATAAAEWIDQWASQKKRNIFGNVPAIREMQSEGGCAGAVHGAGVSGTLSATYTCSQGLLLMIPNMYKLAYEMIPCVFHIASRLVAHHAMSLYCDYSDVFACRDTGFSFLCSANPQECMDLGTIAHLVSYETRIPFLHFFDGLRTSHCINKIETIPESTIKELFPWKSIEEWRSKDTMSTDHPTMRGCGQDSNIFWLCSERTAPLFRDVPNKLQAMFNKFAEKTGRKYNVVDYYGAQNAEYVVIIMGSASKTVQEYVNYHNENSNNKKIGVLQLRLFRPFPSSVIRAAIPQSCKVLCALDRVKQTNAAGEPLFLETLAAVHEDPSLMSRLTLIGGKFAVGGYEFNPMHVKAVFDNMMQPNPVLRFCVGIDDDVSQTSIKIPPPFGCVPKGTVQAKFYGLGADGTVGSCKAAIQMIGENTKLNTQGYFVFDAKKTGGFTFSYLRFGKEPILSEYEIYNGDYVACHHHSFLNKFDVVSELKEGGIFVLNCPWVDNQQIEMNLPASFKKSIAQKKGKLYTINAFAVGKNAGVGGHINMIMSVCFFALADVIPVEQAILLLKNSVRKMYSKKGDDIVKQNISAIDDTMAALHNYKYDEAEWLSSKAIEPKQYGDEFLDNVVMPIVNQKAHLKPVSSMTQVATGVYPSNTSKFEKRSVSQMVPHWDPDACVQCNTCAFVCPHACLRPVIYQPSTDKPPTSFVGTPLKSGSENKDMMYRIQISARDCLSCGLCVEECPKKCLTMRPFGDGVDEEDANWSFAMTLPLESRAELFPSKNAKDAMFHQPLLEFHGACAGCNEPTHMKVITQLFGSEIFLANGVGCSMIWGGYTPTSPYSVDSNGIGPVYATSLFEDNAEFGLGMSVSVRNRRAMLKERIEAALKLPAEKTTPDLTVALQQIYNNFEDLSITKKASLIIKKELEKLFVNRSTSNTMNSPISKAAVPTHLIKESSLIEASNTENDPLAYIYNNKDFLANKTVWVVGGDGWAYDIDFHGLDHLLHSGEDVNIIILDTEVYSNTGGQASKATQRGVKAKLSSSGKTGAKKDFGIYAMSKNACYVASVCIGSNKAQFVKALLEAQAFKGPSVIIAYCPCIAHNVKGGLKSSYTQQRLAVQGGYWPLYRFNPENKNPLQIDYVADSSSSDSLKKLNEFMKNELRFISTVNTENNEEIMEKIIVDVQSRNKLLKNLNDVWKEKESI